MDAHEAEDYIYASYARAASGLSYGGRDSSKRHPELTEEIIRGLSGTPALCVTGSKGKGSVSVMISEALRSEMSVGLMTSPHLVRFTERIRADGAEIPGTDLARCIETLKPAFDRIQAGLDGGRYISPMGIQTAAALMWFRERGTKFNVLECGKGAQYDDVNNAVHTRAVINTVFAEHTRELGANAEEIAMEYHRGGAPEPHFADVRKEREPRQIAEVLPDKEVAVSSYEVLTGAAQGCSSQATRSERSARSSSPIQASKRSPRM